MTLKLSKTDRGFARGEFDDQNGEACSVQKSSLATQDCIWFGVEGDGVPGTRMHLTRDMVRELLPLLEGFAATGELEALPSRNSATEGILAELAGERLNQDRKWDEQNHEFPLWYVILGEELGEACRAFLHEDWSNMREELIQAGALIVAVLESHDRNRP